ncbi:MAG: hypothetical protein ACOYIK_02275 [Coriobacteriales bacterium]
MPEGGKKKMCAVCINCGRCRGETAFLREDPCPVCGGWNRTFDDKCRTCGTRLEPYRPKPRDDKR